MPENQISRGEIWFHRPKYTPAGHIQGGERPVIIVSNNMANLFSSVLLAVPLTTKPKKCKPTHVEFLIGDQYNLAMVEQAGPVDKDSLVNYRSTVPYEVMEKVDRALMIAFGLVKKHNPPARTFRKMNQQQKDGLERFYSKFPHLAKRAEKLGEPDSWHS